MNGTTPQDTKPEDSDGVSDAERSLLRRSVRDFLSNVWPAESAVESSGSPEAIAKLWLALARQGLASLGSNPAEGGLREIVLVFEELGRASCPAPLLGAVAANLAFATQQSNAMRALLEDVHRGSAMIALALGAFDGDLAAGRVAVHGDTLRGTMSFVEGAQAATHFLIVTDAPAGVAGVASGGAGMTMKATPGLAVPTFSELTFEDTPATLQTVPSEALVDIALVARLACAGRALGAAQRAFDLAVDHAKVRKQFGQFVGQFQAVQHKLANCLISLDGARLALDTAAEERDSEGAYMDFVRRAATDPIARQVKIADLEDNMNLLRIAELTDRDLARLKRYHAAWRLLTDGAAAQQENRP